MNISIAELAEKALRIKELDTLIIKSFMENQRENMITYVKGFLELRKEIRKFLVGRSSIALPDEKNKPAREILHRLCSGKKLPSEELLHQLFAHDAELKEYVSDALDDEERDELGSDHFYSWTSGQEFAEALYEVGSLILAVDDAPKSLDAFVDEARNCYALLQYLAVTSLCRTILEVSIRDICVREGLMKGDKDNVMQADSYRMELFNMVEMLCENAPCYRTLRDRFDKIRRRGNQVIHGSRTDKQGSAELLRETLNVVHKLYEQNKQ